MMRRFVNYISQQSHNIEEKEKVGRRGMGDSRVADSGLVGKHEGKKSLGKPRTKWENIKMGVKRNRIGRFGLSYCD
jgi:hypothetical protein